MSVIRNFNFFFPPLQSFFLELESFSGSAVFIGVEKNDTNCRDLLCDNKMSQFQKPLKFKKKGKHLKNGGEGNERGDYKF